MRLLLLILLAAITTNCAPDLDRRDYEGRVYFKVSELGRMRERTVVEWEVGPLKSKRTSGWPPAAIRLVDVRVNHRGVGVLFECPVERERFAGLAAGDPVTAHLTFNRANNEILCEGITL